MSSRGSLPRNGAVALLSIGAAAGVAGWVGCSSDVATSSSAVVADAASGPVRIPSQPDPGFDAGPTCRDDCIARHPVGAPLNAAIDACWSMSCSAACITMTVTDASDAGDAGDAGVPDASAPSCGGIPVATPTDACNTCTVGSCCDAWTACFSAQDCSELNACIQSCSLIVSP